MEAMAVPHGVFGQELEVREIVDFELFGALS